MDFTDDFLKNQREWLIARRQSKEAILKAGGERAKSHSLADLTRIDFAIKRIDQGTYGLCAECGSLIERERLEKYMPETPFCASCAQERNIE